MAFWICSVCGKIEVRDSHIGESNNLSYGWNCKDCTTESYIFEVKRRDADKILNILDNIKEIIELRGFDGMEYGT